MEIVIDGIIYELQERGGISRIFSEVLPRMCDLDPALSVRLRVMHHRKQEPPAHEQLTLSMIPNVRRYLRPGRVWGATAVRVQDWARGFIWEGRDTIWHSTYYTLPTTWRGHIVMTAYDMIYERYPQFFDQDGDEHFRQAKRRAIEAADLTLCISKVTQEDLVSMYGMSIERTRVVPLSYSAVFRQLDTPKDQRLLNQGRPFILYVGGRPHYKGFDTLLAAYAKWRYREKVDLIVVGRMWTGQEKQLLRSLGVEKHVILIPDADDETLCQFYNQALAFVYPSLYEGFGIPLLEAMACGCPVVASEIPTSLEVAGDAPIYFLPGEVESLLDVLDRVMEEDQKERVERGIECAATYSWERTARQTLQAYRELV